MSYLYARALCSFFGLFAAHTSGEGFVRHVGEIWLFVGVGALLFRMIQLFFLKGIQTGLVWATKILTDPFNDAIIYAKAPLYLMRWLRYFILTSA